MSLTINTNLVSLNTQSALNRTRRGLRAVFKRVSSGKRVNTASDDAAGLGVAEKLNATRRSFRVALRNTSDGISTVQVAEGSTKEVGELVKRMRELAIQSASETLAQVDRNLITQEFREAQYEIQRISENTRFNGVPLADGSRPTVEVQVGKNNQSTDRIPIHLPDLTASVLGVAWFQIAVDDIPAARQALDFVDAALNSINGQRSRLGATQNRLESTQRNLENLTENLSASESRIRDADFAYESAQLSKLNIMQQAGVSLLSQANGLDQSALKLVS